MLIEQIKEIKANSIEIIEKDKRLTLLVFEVYANVFAGGKLSKCGTCLRTLYAKVININLEKFEKMAKKTCVLKGMVHVHKLGKHFSDDSMTDELALDMLYNKHLQEKHFKILPKGYDSKKIVQPEKKEEPIELKIENKGKFTEENLKPLNGESVMSFAQKLQPVVGDQKPQKPQSKVKAIEIILKWQKEKDSKAE
jgi:hypothetical protein